MHFNASGRITSTGIHWISGAPSTFTIPPDTWNISKDTTTGNVWLGANDGGIIKTTLIGGFTFGEPAQADTVFQVATTGDDATGDGSVAAPFATIQHALVVASRYDYQGLYNVYINIANGTYTENVVLPDFTSLRNNNTVGIYPRTPLQVMSG
jgi:hypothetical protein